VLVTHGFAGPSYNPWDDTVDYANACISYWGDAKFDAEKTPDQFRGKVHLTSRATPAHP
jgi:hypothetical protein